MPIQIDHMDKGDVVEIPREEFERIQATLEFLEDEGLKKGILKSLQQYHNGESRPWSEVRDDLMDGS